MKDEIKEILDNLEKVKNGVGTFIGIDNKGANLLLDHITNLQDEYKKEHYLVDKLTRQLNDEYKNTEYQCKQKEDYKSRNEKAIEDIDLVIELIKQQPTEDDSWILNKLNGFKYLLNGGDDNEG